MKVLQLLLATGMTVVEAYLVWAIWKVLLNVNLVYNIGSLEFWLLIGIMGGLNQQFLERNAGS